MKQITVPLQKHNLGLIFKQTGRVSTVSRCNALIPPRVTAITTSTAFITILQFAFTFIRLFSTLQNSLMLLCKEFVISDCLTNDRPSKAKTRPRLQPPVKLRHRSVSMFVFRLPAWRLSRDEIGTDTHAFFAVPVYTARNLLARAFEYDRME